MIGWCIIVGEGLGIWNCILGLIYKVNGWICVGWYWRILGKVSYWVWCYIYDGRIIFCCYIFVCCYNVYWYVIVIYIYVLVVNVVGFCFGGIVFECLVGSSDIGSVCFGKVKCGI